MNAQAVKDSLAFLESQQQSNGSFMGESSSSIDSFTADWQHQTIFFTALIMSCLEKVDNSSLICKKAAKYLMSQKSNNWSWNYWQRNSATAHQYPYPDDLDDTARALTALSQSSPELVGPDALANFTKLLIATEKAPGGPYRTWLVQPDLLDKWGDVDPVVNTNIGGFLALHNINLPKLNNYLDKIIANESLASPYYVGIIPSIYFLSVWYRGENRRILKDIVNQKLTRPKNYNSLMLALLITAARNLGVENTKLKSSTSQLLRYRTGNFWPAEALYLDPKINGVQYYAGSVALTTAFALEALNNKKVVVLPASTTPPRHTTVKLAMVSSQKLPKYTKGVYTHALKSIKARDHDKQITNIAGLTAKAYGHKINKETINQLNLASLNGWLAYTIYDDFLDEEGESYKLGTANIALRRAVSCYHLALPDNDAFTELVEETLTAVDEANTWEVSNTRAIIKGQQLVYTLPNYGNLNRLAERSLGHMLSPIGVALACGFSPKSESIISLKNFFKHYLIARQLNDDAHDWSNDLEKGHINAVAAMLLKDFGAASTFNLQDLESLRLCFWRQTINDTAMAINHHLKKARQALSKTGFKNPQTFNDWLNSLAEATELALSGSHDTQSFIKVFGGK